VAAILIAGLLAVPVLRATDEAESSLHQVLAGGMVLPGEFQEDPGYVQALMSGWALFEQAELEKAEVRAREALEVASTREMRAWAARLMGHIYFSKPQPKTSDRLVAWQYLSSAEALTELAAMREAVWPEMLDTAEALNDLRLLSGAAARIRAGSANATSINGLDVKMLKLAVAHGTWRDYTHVLGQIRIPAAREPAAFHYKRQLLAANERLLRDAAWFTACVDGQEALSAEQMRAWLTEATLRAYDELLAESEGADRADLILDYARFLYGAAKYDAAMKLVKEYLGGVEGMRTDEALLLELRLGVKLGQLDDAASAAEAIVRRNGLSPATVQMVSDLSAALNSAGKPRAARALLSTAVRLEQKPLQIAPLVEVLVGLDIREGRAVEAAQWFRSQKMGGLPSKELAALALGGAKQYIARSDWTNAMRWLEWHVDAVPGHVLNADALYAVHQALSGLGGYGTSAMEYGAAALQTGSTDPRARQTRQNIGEFLEKMGLYIMAERFYRGAGVTGYIRSDTRDASQQSLSVMALRTGRCLLKAGRLEEADQALREAYHETTDLDARAEAAAWWALASYGLGQRMEGARRLGLSDPARLSPELVARLAIVRDLTDPLTAAQRAERLEVMLNRVTALPPMERTAAARRIVAEVIGQMRAEGDHAGILKVYAEPSAALTNVVTSEQVVLQKGEAVVHTQGVDALVSLLEKETKGTNNVSDFIRELHNDLTELQTFRREADTAVKRYVPRSPEVGR
jgi:tetratricopeptide (TPR) repeat protein